jgi:hypothetical protein
MIAGKTLVKTFPQARKTNNMRKQKLPEEMLPKMARACGSFGHKWKYSIDRKKCTRLHCEVSLPYTPNEHGRRKFD